MKLGPPLSFPTNKQKGTGWEAEALSQSAARSILFPLDTVKIIYLLGVYLCQEKCLRSGQAHKFKGDGEEDLTVLGPSTEWHLGG